MRVIGPEGENFGVVSVEQALEKAKELKLDLIEISPTAKPPVCKIMDFGKYKYREERKAREARKKAHQTEVRAIRIGIGTSEHDLQMKAKRASEFLEQGDRVRIELMLKGRAKYLDKEFKNSRIKRILDFIPIEHKIVEGPKRGPRGINILLEKN